MLAGKQASGTALIARPQKKPSTNETFRGDSFASLLIVVENRLFCLGQAEWVLDGLSFLFAVLTRTEPVAKRTVLMRNTQFLTESFLCRLSFSHSLIGWLL